LPCIPVLGETGLGWDTYGTDRAMF